MKTSHLLIVGAAATAAYLASAKESLNSRGPRVPDVTIDVRQPNPTPDKDPRPDADTPLVQLAILLDTSSSMEGLIDQARTQLWKIVNEFNKAKKGGKTPVLQVALYEYGKSSLSSESRWIRQIQPFTRDLDLISEELFALHTNGGEEYCGAVIRTATRELGWDPSDEVYKAIFIAGNEPFDQGPVNPIESCRDASKKGIVINTIHCGSEKVGIATHWKDGAMVTDGRFLVIDQDKAVVHIKAPQDEEIVKISIELNKTYLGYGDKAEAAKTRQEAQDKNSAAPAAAAAGASVQRALSKSSVNYDNKSWDLVDAAKDKKFDVSKLSDDQLPAELKGKSPEERKAVVAAKTAERDALQKQMGKLNQAREAYVAEQMKSKASDGKDTLDTAVTKAVREQAGKKGVSWEK